MKKTVVFGLILVLAFISIPLISGYGENTETRGSAHSYLNQGKAYLESHNLKEADRSFSQALREDPRHSEANFYKAVTHLALTMDSWWVKWLFWKFRIKCSYDPYDWRFESPENIPPRAPSGKVIQILFRWFLIPRIATSLDYLEEAESDSRFITHITPLMVRDDPGGDDIEIDLTDVYALEGGLNFFKMILHWLDAYHYDCNFNDFEAEDFDIEDYISSHPEIAVLTSQGNEQMSWAKTCLETAADFFQKAVKNYEQEDDDQIDDLFFIEEADILTIKNRLGELVDALSGPCDIIIDNDEQEKIKINLASFFDNPVPDFRILVPQFDEEGDIIYGTFPDPTMRGMFPEFTQTDIWNLVSGDS